MNIGTLLTMTTKLVEAMKNTLYTSEFSSFHKSPSAECQRGRSLKVKSGKFSAELSMRLKS